MDLYTWGSQISVFAYKNTTAYGADHRSCTGGARITKEGGSLKRDHRAGSVCMSVCLFVTLGIVT